MWTYVTVNGWDILVSSETGAGPYSWCVENGPYKGSRGTANRIEGVEMEVRKQLELTEPMRLYFWSEDRGLYENHDCGHVVATDKEDAKQKAVDECGHSDLYVEELRELNGYMIKLEAK